MLPHDGVHAVQCPALAVEVFVKRCNIGSQLKTGGRSPHEKAQKFLQRLAHDLLGPGHLKQLLLKLGELVRDKCDRLKFEIILPTAPSDAVPKLSFAPPDGRVQAC